MLVTSRQRMTHSLTRTGTFSLPVGRKYTYALVLSQRLPTGVPASTAMGVGGSYSCSFDLRGEGVGVGFCQKLAEIGKVLRTCGSVDLVDGGVEPGALVVDVLDADAEVRKDPREPRDA